MTDQTDQKEVVEEVVPAPLNKVEGALKTLGITKEQVEQMKTNFGRVELTWIDAKPYIYRPLFRRELRHLKDPSTMQGGNEMHMEEKIAQQCVIAPRLSHESMTNSCAGIASTLAALIYNISGFDIDASPVEL